ncbi:MAG: response regulator [Eubacterium sp.]|nr:response regulator [Eubacterium sp.]
MILIFGTLWMGSRAAKDSADAVHSVSLLYLDELAGRREQVVEKNLQEAEKKTSAGQDGEIDPQKMSVLAIDDDPIACEHAKVVLGQVGVRCDTALSGAEALEMVRVSHGRQEDYDLILVDWKMPEMDGLEATRRIRALDRADAKKIPIIALTANAFDEDVQRSLQAGLNAHLSKPAEPDALFETLETLIS